jgi:hypothetical protein
MRYHELNLPFCIHTFTLALIEEQNRKVMNESLEFDESIRHFYKRYDQIKIKSPIEGNSYWFIEMMALHSSDFISLTTLDGPSTYVGEDPSSKMAGMSSWVLNHKNKILKLPLLPEFQSVNPSLIDTFLFDDILTRDQFLVELKLSVPENTRITINQPNI